MPWNDYLYVWSQIENDIHELNRYRHGTTSRCGNTKLDHTRGNTGVGTNTQNHSSASPADSGWLAAPGWSACVSRAGSGENVGIHGSSPELPVSTLFSKQWYLVIIAIDWMEVWLSIILHAIAIPHPTPIVICKRLILGSCVCSWCSRLVFMIFGSGV